MLGNSLRSVFNEIKNI